MAHAVTSKDIPVNGEHLPKGKVEVFRKLCGLIAAGGFVLSIIIFFLPFEMLKGSYSFSWLFATFFFFTIALGGCFWTFLHNLSNSGWGTSIRRIMENVGFVFPFMFVFALPLLLPQVQEFLYEWMTEHRTALDWAKDHGHEGATQKEALQARGSQHDGLLVSKLWYMDINAWFVLLRDVLFRSDSHLHRSRLGDGARLYLVFDHVGSLRLCGQCSQLDGRDHHHDHLTSSRWLDEEGGDE